MFHDQCPLCPFVATSFLQKADHIVLEHFNFLQPVGNQELGSQEFGAQVSEATKNQDPGNVQSNEEDTNFAFLQQPKTVGVTSASFHCNECFKPFAQKRHLLNHHQVHHSNDAGKFECLICGKKFKIKDYVNAHIARFHVKNALSCNACDKKFYTLRYLRNHVAVHHDAGGQKYACQFCFKSFRVKDYLSVHVREFHGSQAFGCDLCSQQFRRRSNLAAHVRRMHRRQEQGRQVAEEVDPAF